MNSRKPSRVDDSEKSHCVYFGASPAIVGVSPLIPLSTDPMIACASSGGKLPLRTLTLETAISKGPLSAAVHPSTTMSQTRGAELEGLAPKRIRVGPSDAKRPSNAVPQGSPAERGLAYR